MLNLHRISDNETLINLQLGTVISRVVCSSSGTMTCSAHAQLSPQPSTTPRTTTMTSSAPGWCCSACSASRQTHWQHRAAAAWPRWWLLSSPSSSVPLAGQAALGRRAASAPGIAAMETLVGACSTGSGNHGGGDGTCDTETSCGAVVLLAARRLADGPRARLVALKHGVVDGDDTERDSGHHTYPTTHVACCLSGSCPL